MADEQELIDGIYQFRSLIARGNKTIVQEVIENGTNRRLAMKLVIEGQPEPTKEAKAVLKAEAAISKNLQHPNIIQFESFSTSRDATYILMEFFRAANVKAQLKSELPSLHSRVRPLLEGVCQALIYLHDQGLVHRDLKPENILFNRSGEVKLLDFSLAVRYSQGLGKMLGFGGKKIIQGTRTYIAPETILKKAPGPQTDIYSLGVTFFEILTGKTPFQGWTPQDLLQKHLRLPPPLATNYNPNLTQEVDHLLLAMLAKKVADRPASMQEVYGEIRRIKIFQKDALEIQAEKDQLAHNDKMSLVSVLDSRTDADRSQQLRDNPELAQQFELDRKVRKDRRKPKQKAPSKGLKEPKPSAQQNAMMPQQQPMMPQQPMMYPGMMQQPMMQQPMMYPGMMPQQMMPQFPPQGMPSFPQPGYGQFPQPGYGMPDTPMPQVPLASWSSPQQPVVPVEVQPQPSAPPAAPQAPPAAEPSDMDYMTELPDVL